MYRKLFINVFHLQQFAQVINYFECLSISNDWFPLWYTPLLLSSCHIQAHCCTSSVEAFSIILKHDRMKSHNITLVLWNVTFHSRSFSIQFLFYFKSNVRLPFSYIKYNLWLYIIYHLTGKCFSLLKTVADNSVRENKNRGERNLYLQQ